MVAMLLLSHKNHQHKTPVKTVSSHKPGEMAECFFYQVKNINIKNIDKNSIKYGS
ncbi:hypothetical protein [Mucilaginibacter arboris]|uniref:Uncharacterized protein n=1 Tax=Mucilaginibacter arboris TaxID=2682090 RepID=A0A7K1SWH9_9SPHI|nr:hypothetical protein [Mucilaginibacter arboris]MVN21598.1 hypothetical protein [Mucilaginibacter arboris]